MDINQEQLDRISEIYNKALLFIENNDYKSAHKIVYNLDPDDYDLALDMLFNYNGKYKNEELRKLIGKVDTLLTKDSKSPYKSSSFEDELDKFGDVF